MNCDVVEVDAALIIVGEHARSVTLTTLVLLGLFKGAKFIASLTFSLGLCDLEFALRYGFLETLLFSTLTLFVKSGALLLLLVRSILSLLGVLSAEVNELLTEVYLVLIGVSLKFLELCLLPISTLSILFLFALLLLSFDFGALSVAFLC